MSHFFQFIFSIFIYPVLWVLAAFVDDFHVYISILMYSLSIVLFMVEINLNHKYIFQRIIETFQITQYQRNIIISGSISLVLIFLLRINWFIFPEFTILIIGVLGSVWLGMCVGNNTNRKDKIPSLTTFPNELSELYEKSKNPNIGKTYGALFFLIIPLFLLSIFLDWKIIGIVIILQLDNIYSRLRMNIPISIFLVTNYEKSIPTWLLLKKAAREYSIASLVLDRRNKIPKEIPVQQDLVRMADDVDWIESVKLVAKHCEYIIIDTHSSSPALEIELDLILNSNLVKKVLFIDRQNKDAKVEEALEKIKNKYPNRRFLFQEEHIYNALRTLRNKRMTVS